MVVDDARRAPVLGDPMISHALEYAAKGWQVLPLNGKTPLTVHGVDDASNDLGVVRAWWTRWPDANIGARVSEKLLVLDVDPRNGGNPNDLHTVEFTMSCFTGRGDGGRHLYYLRPAGALTSSRLPKGIDLKVNGYMVMPPSIHPATGEPYLWWARNDPVRPLPSHLLELLRRTPSNPRPMVRSGDSKGLVEFVSRQSEGNRNSALFWAACRAVEDGTLDEIRSDLEDVAEAIGLDRRAAAATIESASRSRGVNE